MTGDTKLIREMYSSIKVLITEVSGLKEHIRENNGELAILKRTSLKQEGALSVLRGMLSFTLAGISAGAALATVILITVAR